jgi:hypothetical protein
MGMDLRITAESRFLLIIATGRFSIEEGKRTFLEILDAVARDKIKKVLFDERELM